MEFFKDMGYLFIFPGFIFSIIMGLFLAGVDRKIVARMQRRKGPKLTQPIYDFIKLLGKESIVPENANRKLFNIVPYIGLASICIIPLFIPIYNMSFIGGTADIVVILYLLVIPSVALIIGGMTSGSPYASIGVSREVVTMVAYELPLVICLISVCKKAGFIIGEGMTFSLNNIMLVQQGTNSFIFSLSLIPAAIAFLMVMPAKVGVPPFDVAEAETEICEGPLVEYSGLPLGIFKLTHNVKVYVMTALFVVLFLGGVGISTGTVWVDIILNIVLLIVMVTVLSILFLSIVRGIMGRYKTHQMFKFYWTVPTILALLSYILVSLNI